MKGEVSIKDKDPFANADAGAEPKDNATLFGVAARYWVRSSRLIVWIPIYLLFGIIFYLVFSSSLGFLLCIFHAIYRLVKRLTVLNETID